MENNRSSKVVAIAALLVAVVGLSIGFAAFSNTLKISSGATVTPDSDTFKVRFSSTEGTTTGGTVTGKALTGEGYVAGATADDATINNDATEGDNVVVPKISGLNAQFTHPGQTVEYDFFVRNDGEYIAYLKSITFGSKACAAVTEGVDAADQADSAKVAAACNDITLTVKVGETAYTATNAAVTGQQIGTAAAVPVKVTIDYAKSDASPVDGPFTVTFGDVVLVYSSVQ